MERLVGQQELGTSCSQFAQNQISPWPALVLSVQPPLSGSIEVGGPCSGSLSKFFLSDSICGKAWDPTCVCPPPSPAKRSVAPLDNFARGGAKPEGQEQDLVKLTFCGLRPCGTQAFCQGQELPATQVSSCCNKLLLTQDYGSFQIPPREQGNKHALPRLPVVPPVGNPCLYLLLLHAFVWEVCETIPAHFSFRHKLNVSIVRQAQ